MDAPRQTEPGRDPGEQVDPQAEPKAAEQVGDGLLCARCRYPLRGLRVDGSCPECGVPVRSSVLASAGRVDPQAIIAMVLAALSIGPFGGCLCMSGGLPGVVLAGVASVMGWSAWRRLDAADQPTGLAKTATIIALAGLAYNVVWLMILGVSLILDRF